MEIFHYSWFAFDFWYSNIYFVLDPNNDLALVIQCVVCTMLENTQHRDVLEKLTVAQPIKITHCKETRRVVTVFIPARYWTHFPERVKQFK